jgi:hypothetical protein
MIFSSIPSGLAQRLKRDRMEGQDEKIMKRKNAGMK